MVQNEKVTPGLALPNNGNASNTEGCGRNENKGEVYRDREGIASRGGMV